MFVKRQKPIYWRLKMYQEMLRHSSEREKSLFLFNKINIKITSACILLVKVCFKSFSVFPATDRCQQVNRLEKSRTENIRH